MCDLGGGKGGGEVQNGNSAFDLVPPSDLRQIWVVKYLHANVHFNVANRLIAGSDVEGRFLPTSNPLGLS